MSDFLKPTSRKQPDKLIIHGTNDLQRSNPTDVAGSIIKLAEKFKGITTILKSQFHPQPLEVTARMLLRR